MLTAVKTIVWRKDRALIREMHKLRDDTMRSTESGREICEVLKTFGSVESTETEELLSKDYFFAERDLCATTLQDVDVRLCMPVLHITSSIALEEFSAQLSALFPYAAGDVDMLCVPREDLALPGPSHALLIGPLKGASRILVKMAEYREENDDPNKWVFASKVGDMVRAMIVCVDSDGVLEAWKRCASGFDIKTGHGRCKNEFGTTKHKPPDMLLNVRTCSVRDAAFLCRSP